MPRKSSRSEPLVRHLPLTFSPFARSMELLGASKKRKRQHQKSVNKEEFAGSTSDNGSVKNAAFNDTDAPSDSSSDESDESEVQVDFVFSNPQPSDFHGAKLLLQNYLHVEEWDLSGFADLIVGQTTVGSVVIIDYDGEGEGEGDDGDDDVIYGLITALNLNRYKDHNCFKELQEYLKKVCPKDDALSSLESLLGERAHTVGLLVSQRVVNCPPQLLPSLYDHLFDEVSEATEKQPTEELRNSFCFKSYIMLCKIYKAKNTHKTGKRNRSTDDIIYTKLEDEIFHELSSFSFTFPLPKQKVSDEMKAYQLMGLVMVVDASKIPTFRKKLHALINES